MEVLTKITCTLLFIKLLIMCEFCKQGTILKAIVNKTNNVIEICDECDTVWYEDSNDVKVTNFDQYMSNINLPPLWDEITILND